ncbi:hypothetical protein Tco_1136490 [Tanacetum coccineum]
MALPPRHQRHRYLRFEGGVRRRMSWREFIFGMGLHTIKEIESVGFGARWAESARQIPDFARLTDGMKQTLGNRLSMVYVRDNGEALWRMNWRAVYLALGFAHLLEVDDGQSLGFGVIGPGHCEETRIGTTLSYTSIRDPMLRLCHRGVDVGLVNTPYRLARYLRMFASGRKLGAMISRGQFVAPPGPKRQHVTTVGAPKVIEDAPIVDEGAPAILVTVQAPQPPPAARPARTMP